MFEKSDWENQKRPDKEHSKKKPTKARISRSVDGKENVELVLKARPEGGRGRGGPRLEWEEYVERLARKRGRKLPEVRRLAQNRKEYRKWLLERDALQQKGTTKKKKNTKTPELIEYR
jgi:hypothetical protein